VNHRTPWLPTA